MIVIAGPGRSGTSLVAAVCADCGVAPGGAWRPGSKAGYEDREFVDLNNRVAQDLGVTTPGLPAFGLVHAAARPATRWLQVETKMAIRHWYLKLPWKRIRRIRPVRWDRVEEVAASRGDALRGYAASHRLAKDPNFTWTLPVWIAAGAEIDHVVLCVRDVDAMTSSRSAIGLSFFDNASVMRAAFAYGIGLALTSLWDHGISHSVLRFPDFLDDPSTLAAALAPTGISPPAVSAALAGLTDRGLVSHSGALH